MLESHMDAKNYLDQARRNKKKIPGGWGGATSQEILSATMAGWRRKFSISNRLKTARKT